MPRGEKFEFTDDQINYIVANWGEESAHSMKKKFGCSWYAVCGVAKEHGLDMPESEKWTDEQVKELMEMSDKMHYEKIAKLLGKTKNAIYLKAKKLNITLIQDKRTWTKEELEYLTENWGVHSINYLAKKLKHSINAVKIKAYRLGLGATMDNTDFLLVSDIIEMLGISRDRICGTWVDLGLKLKKHNVSDKKFYYCIKLENLIAFLKDHQDEWDSRKLDMYMLGAEEEWLVEKRKKILLKIQ